MSTKIASLFASIGADVSGFEAGAKKVKGGLASLGGEIRSMVPSSVTSFLSLSGAVTGVALALKGTMDASLQYANEVRQLSQISGESAEETSRFLQVLDDYKISASEALVATRALTKEGHTPSIQTLAQLSDQYLSLNTAEEKNAFVLKNLGRGGLAWVEVLNKGSKALLEQGEAVNKSLILSQKMVDDARKNEIAVDNWNDSVQALKISIGNGLLPIMTSFINHINTQTRAKEILLERGINPAIASTKEYRDALAQANAEQEASTNSMLKNADAIQSDTEAAQANAEALKLQEEAIKSATKANEGYLSLIGDLTSDTQSYKEKMADLGDEHRALLVEKQNLINQGWWAESEKVQEVNQKLAENEQAQRDNAAEFELASRTRILSMLEEQLAVDGLDARETEYLLQTGLKWGVYSQDAVNAARAAQAEVRALTNQLNSIPTQKDITITTRHFDIYSSPNLGGNVIHARAQGGPVWPGASYMVGERGPEMFTPSQSGNVTPNSQMGNAGIDYGRMARAFVQALDQRGI